MVEIGRRAGIFREPGHALKQDSELIVNGVLDAPGEGRRLARWIHSGWARTDASLGETRSEVPDRGGNKRIIGRTGYGSGVSRLPERPDTTCQLPCPDCNRRRDAKPFEEFVRDRLADGNEWTDYNPDD